MGAINAAFWNGDSYYNAFVLQVRKQIRRGLQVGGSYTWGKSIDTSSGSAEGDEYSNAMSSPLWFDTRLNRGQSDYDITPQFEDHLFLAIALAASGFRAGGLGARRLAGGRRV